METRESSKVWVQPAQCNRINENLSILSQYRVRLWCVNVFFSFYECNGKTTALPQAKAWPCSPGNFIPRVFFIQDIDNGTTLPLSRLRIQHLYRTVLQGLVQLYTVYRIRCTGHSVQYYTCTVVRSCDSSFTCSIFCCFCFTYLHALPTFVCGFFEFLLLLVVI